MKKILSFALVLVMLFSLFTLTSCEGAPAEVVGAAIEKTESLDSYEATMTTAISISMGTISMELPMVIDIKAEGLATETPTVYTKTTVNFAGEESVAEVYIAGEYAYIIQGDAKIKVKLEAIEDTDASVGNAELVESLMKELPEELFTNVEFKASEDGAKTVTVNIPDSVFDELFDDFAEGMGTALEELTDGIGEVTISDAKVDIAVKDGYMTKYAMTYTMTISEGGVSFSAGVEAALEFKNPGSKVTVTLPDGYESFRDVTDSYQAAPAN